MAQINPTMGDINGNTRLILDYCRRAQDAKADLVIFPEMAVTGYPPNDLLPPREVRPPAGNRKPNQEAFVRDNKQSITEVADRVNGITVVVGFVDYDEINLHNSAAIINNGKLSAVSHKTLLPTYDVFDELRYFTPAQTNLPISIAIRGQQNNDRPDYQCKAFHVSRSLRYAVSRLTRSQRRWIA